MPSLDASQSGRIDRIEVSNFKSYKGDQVIGPFRNFTAIIGPNGAGKSNLMDAISFVLGVRSVHLRGDKLRDLVYSLGDSDPEKPRRRAHVALVFARADGRELRLMRAITTSGASEYRVDGSVVDWERYNQTLKDIGILVKARNFLVFQGDVESIASKNPKELTALFEQISGSEEFRRDYDKLAEEKSRAEEQVTFSFQRKKNMTVEKKQRKEQKDEAERHLALQNELKEKKAERFLWQLYMNEKEASEATKQKAKADAELDKIKKELEELEAQIAEQSRASAACSKEVISWAKKVAKKEAEMEKKLPEMTKLKEAQKRAQQKLIESRRALEQKKKAQRKQLEVIDQLKRQLEDVKAELDTLESEDQDPATQGVKLAADQVEEYKQKKNLVGTKTNKLKGELKELARRQQTDLDARQQLEQNLQQLQEREEQLKATVEQGEANIARIGSDLKEAQEKLKSLKEEEKNVEDANRAYRHRRERREKELEAVESELREAKADRRKTEHEKRMEEAVSTMKRLFPGVQGRLSELCKPTQHKYELAYVVAMGKFFDAVAVEDEPTAKECIQYLRDQRLPPMTFIPLATARIKPVQERLRELGGTSKLVVDVLRFDEVIKTAVLYAVGNTLVCDTVDEARRLAWGAERHKVVALDGTLLSKNGCMTGGTSESIAEKARRIQTFSQKIEDKKAERDRLQAELEEMGSPAEGQAREQEIKSTITGLERRIHYAKLEQRTAQDKLQRANRDLRTITEQRARMVPSIGQLSQAMAQREEEIQQKETRMNEITDRIFADFCRRVGVTNIREYEDEPLKQAQQLAEHKLQLEGQCAKLENQLEYEARRDLAEPITVLEKTIERAETELEELVKRAESLQAAHDSMNQELEQLQNTVKELKSKAEEAEEIVQATAKQRSSRSSAVGKAKRDVTAKETLLVQLEAKRKELLEACEMEEIRLSTRAGSSVPMEVDSGGGPPSEALVQSLDYSSLPRQYLQASDKAAQEKLMEQINQKMEELSAELANTAPNLKALEQYEAVKEKERQATEEFDSVRKEAKAITDQFLEKKQLRTERFMKAFEHISNTIDRIYKDLTASKTHPLGGSAYLSLESEEEPFQHGIKFTAMPPTKRFRDMEQLSGGEKTVAALALLFSIHSFKPSPFFVLDEVDAALDNLNVAKVAAYIRSKSRDDVIRGLSDGQEQQRRSRDDGEAPQVAGFQSVVISLKDQFFDKADALVGVYRDTRESCSKVLTFDLDKYPAA